MPKGAKNTLPKGAKNTAPAAPAVGQEEINAIVIFGQVTKKASCCMAKVSKVSGRGHFHVWLWALVVWPLCWLQRAGWQGRDPGITLGLGAVAPTGITPALAGVSLGSQISKAVL